MAEKVWGRLWENMEEGHSSNKCRSSGSDFGCEHFSQTLEPNLANYTLYLLAFFSEIRGQRWSEGAVVTFSSLPHTLRSWVLGTPLCVKVLHTSSYSSQIPELCCFLLLLLNKFFLLPNISGLLFFQLLWRKETKKYQETIMWTL